MHEKQIYHPKACIANGLKEQQFKQWFKFSAATTLQRLEKNNVNENQKQTTHLWKSVERRNMWNNNLMQTILLMWSMKKTTGDEEKSAAHLDSRIHEPCQYN